MRVLFLTHRLPYAPNRGDRIRAFHIVRTLAAAVDMDVVSLVHDQEEAAQVGTLEALGVRVTACRTAPWRGYLRATLGAAGGRPATHHLLDAPGLKEALESVVRQRPPDLVLAYCSGMARFAVEEPLAKYPFVLDFVDVDSQKWVALAERTAWPKRWIYRREARCLGRFEARAALRAAASLVVNDREREVLRRLSPDARIHVVGNGVSLDDLKPTGPPANAPRVVFCGVMNYEPNVEAVTWFAREAWPDIRKAYPEAVFQIVGSNPTSAVERLRSIDGIEVTGRVADVRPYLWQSAVSVAPLFTARGIQNKVLEALAAGVPTVVTPQVYEGLPDRVRPGCRVAGSRDEFVGEVLAILALSPAERRHLSLQADLGELTWDAQLASLPRILRDAASSPSRMSR